MADNKKYQPTAEQRRESVLQNLWLTYYNDTLYEQGVITEAERNQMRLIIKKRTSAMQR